MEAWTTVCGGGQHKRALEPHHEEEVASKRINLGQKYSRVEHRTQASTVAVPEGSRRHKKRALELKQEDSDDYEYHGVKEATFMAGADGAYISSEMPKRINLGYNVGETSPRARAWDAADERDAALILRLTSEVRAYTKMYHQQ